MQRGTSQTSRGKGHNQGLSLKTNGKDAKSLFSSISPSNGGCIRTCSPPSSNDLQVRRLAHTSVHPVVSASPSGNQFQA